MDRIPVQGLVVTVAGKALPNAVADVFLHGNCRIGPPKRDHNRRIGRDWRISCWSSLSLNSTCPRAARADHHDQRCQALAHVPYPATLTRNLFWPRQTRQSPPALARCGARLNPEDNTRIWPDRAVDVRNVSG
jgi:hypothetical protein